VKAKFTNLRDIEINNLMCLFLFYNNIGKQFCCCGHPLFVLHFVYFDLVLFMHLLVLAKIA
jgi:hypothetical protein